MQKEYALNGSFCDQQYVDCFGQITVFQSVPIKGMKEKDREGKANHGPGVKTAGFRPLAKKVQRGFVVVSD